MEKFTSIETIVIVFQDSEAPTPSLHHEEINWLPQTLSVQSDVKDLWYFIIWIQSAQISLKYQRFTPPGRKDIEIRLIN